MFIAGWVKWGYSDGEFIDMFSWLRRKTSIKKFHMHYEELMTDLERLYADIDFELVAVVSGVLYCISQRDLFTLDTYEGCPRIYRRIWVEVDCEGETFVAATYQMTPETKVLRAGQPYPEDYRRICSVGANFHQIPNNFISRKIFFKLKRSSK